MSKEERNARRRNEDSGELNNEPYKSPEVALPAFSRNIKTGAILSLAWWESRRLRYNLALVVTGNSALTCYVIVCFTLLLHVRAEIEFCREEK
jgi:hypothetical protein